MPRERPKKRQKDKNKTKQNKKQNKTKKNIISISGIYKIPGYDEQINNFHVGTSENKNMR